MTNRERVIAAIHFEQTDIVPYSVSFCEPAYEKLVQLMGKTYVDSINDHISTIGTTKPQVEIKPGYFRDEFGVVWNKTGADRDIGVPDFWLIPDAESFEKYTFPPVDETYIRNQCEYLMSLSPACFRGANIGFSLFERLWTMMGMENALSNMLLEPALIHQVLSRICEWNLAVLDVALEYDYDFFYFGDDWGQQHGLIMGPTHWRTFIKPYLAKMYARVKQSGKYIIQHSCGDIREILDELHELGLNIYQTFQPEIYGLGYSEKLRGKISILGGISTQRDLPNKTPDEIRHITRNTINHFKPHGGLIVSPTHAIPGDVPAENMVAMLDVFMNQ